MTRFSRAVFTVSNFVDQTGQSAFIANIHPSKPYKYLLEHQKMPTFIALMEAASSHVQTKENMSSFPSTNLKSTASQLVRRERHNDTRSKRSYRPNRHLDTLPGG